MRVVSAEDAEAIAARFSVQVTLTAEQVQALMEGETVKVAGTRGDGTVMVVLQVPELQMDEGSGEEVGPPDEEGKSIGTAL